MGYCSRKPTPNDPPRKRGAPGNDIMDGTAMILSGLATRCTRCRLIVGNTRIITINGEKVCLLCAGEK